MSVLSSCNKNTNRQSRVFTLALQSRSLLSKDTQGPQPLKPLPPSRAVFYPQNASPPSFTQKCFLPRVGLWLSLVMLLLQFPVVGNCFLFFTLGSLQYKHTFRVMSNVFKWATHFKNQWKTLH
jgi:hypothetical protein